MTTEKDKTTTALVTVEKFQERFPVLAEASEVGEAIAENFPDGLGPRDLVRGRLPSGGGTRWVLVDADGEVEGEPEELVGVVIYFDDQRVRWAGEFGKVPKGTPPLCTSRDGKTGVGDPGGDCATCAFAQFGPDGEKPECKARKMLFLLREGDWLPTLVNLPIKSIPPLRSYFRKLAVKGVMYWKCVTRFALTGDQNREGVDFSKIAPSMDGSKLPPDVLELVAAYRKSTCEPLKDVSAADDSDD